MCIVFDGDNIKTILSLTPSLLDAGLLQLLVEDLFTVGDSHIRPFNQWDGGEGLTPLQRLYAVSHYPRVTQALLRALGSTTLKESAVLAHPNLDKRAVTFGAAILVYKPALSAYCSASAITEPCCSLEHYRHKPLLPPAKVQECSWCHSVAYCSHGCQKRDWEMMHRNECADSRVKLIDLRLNGVQNLHQAAWQSGRPKRCPYLADLRSMLVNQYYDLTIEGVLGWEEGGTALFADDRARAILGQYVDSDSQGAYGESRVQLACSISALGQYTFATMATFLVRHHFASTVSDEEPEYQVDLLNGYLKVVKGSIVC
ncbi:hypothetical protein FA13DRAFT_1739182 [Coprinellus micaceus]|uniref:MYND-type domain-containing protein n=1 Tax=Coprinellus micaceus TaxID=71717 RepID=A0A4Y7SS73_COPMI|nr:hypothetical protein FA13DRAFT_1739182 [Coprinellus micaceus]